MKMIMVKSKVFIDSIWSFIERFSVQGLQFLFSIILARLLSPSDYGLIAMLSIFWLFHKHYWIVGSRMH